jgi:hypothetical protein
VQLALVCSKNEPTSWRYSSALRSLFLASEICDCIARGVKRFGSMSRSSMHFLISRRESALS